jgi:hypothetical protein
MKFIQNNLIIGVTLVLGLLLSNCKFTGPNYQLEVTIEENITGTPLSGVYSYKEFTEIEYKFTPKEESIPVEVLINDSKQVSSGTLTLFTNTRIIARVFEIKDTWNIRFTKVDGSTETWSMTFQGDNYLNGTFSDDRGYFGTWKIVDKTLTITYSNWADYVLTASIETMNGTWAGETLSQKWAANRKLD